MFWFSEAIGNNWYAMQYSTGKKRYTGKVGHKNAMEKADKICFEQNEVIFGYKVGVYFTLKDLDRPIKQALLYDFQSQRDLVKIDYSDPNYLKLLGEITSEGLGSYNYLTYLLNQ